MSDEADAIWDAHQAKGATVPDDDSSPGLGAQLWDWFRTRPSGEKINPLTADYWTTPIGGGEPRSMKESITGPLLQVLGGVPMGEETVAGGTALLDALGGQDIGQAYDSRIDEVRGLQKGFEERNPNLSTGLSLGGALKTPIMNLGAKVSKMLPAAKSTIGALGRSAAIIPAIAGEGALIGGAYGYGAGEGGVEPRLEKALEGAQSGGVLAGLLGAPATLASEGIKKLTPEIEETAKGLKRYAHGARTADYKKTAKDIDFFDIPDDDLKVESLTKKSLDKVIGSGALEGKVDPGTTTKLAAKEMKRLSQAVSKEIAEVDSSRQGRRIIPKFSGALEYIKKGKVQADEADKYLEKINSLKNSIKEKGGSLRFLQEQKKALRGKYIEGDDAANGFWRAMYHDVQKAIESEAPKVKAINKELQAWKIVFPIFKKGLSTEEGVNILEKFWQTLRTSGAKTITGPALLGTLLGGALGGPLGSSVGTKLGATAGAALGVGSSPKGQQAIADKLLQLTKSPSSIMGGPPRLETLIAALNAQANEE